MTGSLRLSPTAYLDHLRSESARFHAVLAECDPSASVPGCPEWNAADLLWHLSEVQWFWGSVIQARPAGPETLTSPERPVSHARLLTHFAHSSHRLMTALAAADPSDAAWSWAAEQTVGFTFRRQAHEALIHRLDAEQAAGSVTPLDPRLAADGVAEIFEVMYGGDAPPWGRIEPGADHVRIDLVDVGAQLWVQPCMFFGTDPDTGKTYDGPHVVVVEDPGVGPDAVIAGPAEALDAWLWKRRDAEGIDISGDRKVLRALMAAVGTELD